MISQLMCRHVMYLYVNSSTKNQYLKAERKLFFLLILILASRRNNRITYANFMIKLTKLPVLGKLRLTTCHLRRVPICKELSSKFCHAEHELVKIKVFLSMCLASTYCPRFFIDVFTQLVDAGPALWNSNLQIQPTNR